MTEQFNPNSPQQLSKLLFDILGIPPLPEWKTKKEGVYQTNEKVLDKCKDIAFQLFAGAEKGTYDQKRQDAAVICNLILEIRGIKKQISTYYDSTEKYLDENDYVHAQFCHCVTGTGRLGCSSPNIQNQPERKVSKVKEHFVSRFVPSGKLLSADYSQLEIVVQAQLSGDKQYIQDVVNGVDFHVKRLALKEGMSYDAVYEKVETEESWVSKRKAVKGFSFARAYGAGARKISEQTGMEESDIKVLIEKENQEYPRLTCWYDWLNNQVQKEGHYQGFTGRKYNFKKYPPKFKWQKTESYSPTEIRNYIVQGTATADIVLIMLGKFWREKAIHNRDKYLLVNTVHDSVMLDCKAEYIEVAKKDIKLLERVKLLCYNSFKYDWIVPIKIDIVDGEKWSDL